MFAIRRAAARAITSHVSCAPSLPRQRLITTISTSIVKPSSNSISLSLQRRFASHDAVEKAAVAAAEESDTQRNASEAVEVESTATEPLAPETTTAAEFDASDVQPIEPKEVRSEYQSRPYARSNSSDRSTRPSRDDPPSKELFVSNLFFDVTEEDLRREFSRFGTVVDIKIIKDTRGLSKGFGFVSFLDQTDATSAKDGLQGQVFEGRTLGVYYSKQKDLERVDRARQGFREARPKAPPSRTLYIGNMSFELSDQDLSKMFSGIKNVLDVRVAIDRRTGQPRGFAHADFTDIESAELAFKKLDGTEVYGRKLICDYSSPTSRVRTRGEDS